MFPVNGFKTVGRCFGRSGCVKHALLGQTNDGGRQSPRFGAELLHLPDLNFSNPLPNEANTPRFRRGGPPFGGPM